MNEHLEGALRTLTEREEAVLRLRYGIGDGYPRTLEEAGKPLRCHQRTGTSDRNQSPAQTAPSAKKPETRDFID